MEGQNGETSSQSLKTQPRIRDRPMHRVQKPDPNLGDVYARGAETCLRFKGYLCTGCKSMPRIQGMFFRCQNVFPRIGVRFSDVGMVSHNTDSRLCYIVSGIIITKVLKFIPVLVYLSGKICIFATVKV